jgi:putative transposase
MVFRFFQMVVVHQIRNSLKYVASKDQKPFMTELKPVYKAVNESQDWRNWINSKRNGIKNTRW